MNRTPLNFSFGLWSWRIGEFTWPIKILLCVAIGILPTYAVVFAPDEVRLPIWTLVGVLFAVHSILKLAKNLGES